jgi:hypothetical protein
MRSADLTATLRLVASLGLAVAVLLLPCSGCSKAGKKKKPQATAAARSGEGDEAEAAPDEPAADAVAEEWVEGVDPDTALTVDRGRIVVMSPTGWIRGAQSKDYLVKYVPSRQKTFPSIVVTAADPPDGLVEIDSGNQREFVKAIADSLAATFTKNGKSTLVKKPAAMTLGPHLGVTWAAPATIKVAGVSESIDRSSYAVVIGGRMYTVEVRAPKGKLDAEGRAAARAVTAALGQPEAAAPAEPAANAAPATDAAPEAAAEAGQ